MSGMGLDNPAVQSPGCDTKMTHDHDNDQSTDKRGYHESKHTESVPTKSADGSVSYSTTDPLHSDDVRSVSRPSSSGEDLPPEDKELLARTQAVPSDTEPTFVAKTLARPSIEEEYPTSTFRFGKQGQSTPPDVPLKSNQEHQSVSGVATKTRPAADSIAEIAAVVTQELVQQPDGSHGQKHVEPPARVQRQQVPQAPSRKCEGSKKPDLSRPHNAQKMVSPPSKKATTSSDASNALPSRGSKAVGSPMKAVSPPQQPVPAQKSHGPSNENEVFPDNQPIFCITEEQPVIKHVTKVAKSLTSATLTNAAIAHQRTTGTVPEALDRNDSRSYARSHEQATEAGEETSAVVQLVTVEQSPDVQSVNTAQPNAITSRPSSRERATVHSPPQPDVTVIDSTAQAYVDVTAKSKAQPRVARSVSLGGSVHVRKPVKEVLRKVSDRGGAPKVAKRATKQSQGATQKPRSSVPSSAELLELFRYRLQQEALQKHEEVMIGLNAKEVELRKANDMNETLTKQLHDVQADKVDLSHKVEELRLKLQRMQGKGERFARYLTGLGNDIGSLKKADIEYAQEFRNLKSMQIDIRRDIDTYGTDKEQSVETLKKLKADQHGFMQQYAANLETRDAAKAYLEERLKEKVGMLSEERNRGVAFDQQLKEMQTQQQSVQEMFRKCTDDVIAKLDGVQSSTDQIALHDELVKLIKTESEKLNLQGQGCLNGSRDIKEVLTHLSSTVQKHIDDSGAGQAARGDAEKQMTNTLQSIMTDMQSRESLAEKNAALQETINGLQEVLQANKTDLHARESEISRFKTQEESLSNEVSQLKSSVASLQKEDGHQESWLTQIETLSASNKRLQQDITALKDQETETMARAETLVAEKKSLHEKNVELQNLFAESQRLLVGAKQLVPDFSAERAELQEKAKQDLEKLRIENIDHARQISRENSSQVLRVMNERKAMVTRLAAREDSLRHLHSRLQQFQVVSGGRDASFLSTELARLRTELVSAKESCKLTQQELQQVEESRDANVLALRKQTKEVRNAQEKIQTLQKQFEEATSARTSIENDFHALEAESRRQRGEEQKKIAEAQHKLDEITHQLEKLDELRVQENDAAAQKDAVAAHCLKELEELLAQAQRSATEKDALVAEMRKKEQDMAQRSSLAKDTSQGVSFGPNESAAAGASDKQTPIAQRKVRRPVHRGLRTESQASSLSTQEHVDRSTNLDTQGNDGARPVDHESFSGSQMLNDLDDDDMLDLDNAQLQFRRTNSRPATSQSEHQRAHALGSQEVLDNDGVRVRSRNDETQSNGRESTSSALSPVRQLSPSYEKAAEMETQDQGLSQTKETQPSLDMDGHDEFSLPSQSDNETTDRRNLQGKGRKMTPRPESQATPAKQKAMAPGKLPARSGALPILKTSSQKKVSRLDSGPHNFRSAGAGKAKQRMTEAEDESGSDPITGPGNQLKRKAPQSLESVKKARTTTTSSAEGQSRQGQRGGGGMALRSSSVMAASSESRSSGMPGSKNKRRQSGKGTREQSMMSRFNDEISSPQSRRS